MGGMNCGQQIFPYIVLKSLYRRTDNVLLMTKGYSKKTTCAYLMNYHFVWCPLYRKAILTDEIRNRTSELISHQTESLGGRVLELSIMPDHVHLFVSLVPTISPNQFIGKVKGMTSRVLRDEFPFLTKRASLWTRSYFVSTAGNVSSEVIQQYIRGQLE